MIAKNQYSVSYPPPVSLPFPLARKAKRNGLPNLLSNNTTSETIEILERSGSLVKDHVQLTYALLVAAGAIMAFATLAVYLVQLPGILETQIQFGFEDVERAIAGR